MLGACTTAVCAAAAANAAWLDFADAGGADDEDRALGGRERGVAGGGARQGEVEHRIGSAEHRLRIVAHRDA